MTWSKYTTGQCPEGTVEVISPDDCIEVEEVPRRVEVTWWDAWNDDAYYVRDTIEHMPPALRKDIGYLLEENDTTITLTSELVDISFTGEHRCRGIRTIYKGMIEKIVDMEETK